MELFTLFKFLDNDQDNYIDHISFKRILNMIGYPLKNIDENKYLYTYNDLLDYIIKYNDITKINKELLKNKLNEKYKEQDVNYIIDSIDKSNSKFVNLDRMNSFANIFLDE